MIVNNSKKPTSQRQYKHIYSEYLTGNIWIIHVPSAGMYFLRYIGENELYLNGQIIQQDKVYVLNTGTSIRNHHVKPFISAILSVFSRKIWNCQRIVFEAEEVSYRFKGGTAGVHHISFCEESGRLVGIMGSSGAGKSTLLNILNGSMEPAEGRVLINGIDIYKDKVKSNGLIGHVSQDDLLIEELTVYQNLYYNTKLCFDNYTEEQI